MLDDDVEEEELEDDDELMLEAVATLLFVAVFVERVEDI